MKTNECTLLRSRTENDVYAVLIDAMAAPAAWFSCLHCAMQWAIERAPSGYKIARLVDPQLIGDLLDKIADVEIVHGSHNAPTGGALYKHELEV